MSPAILRGAAVLLERFAAWRRARVRRASDLAALHAMEQRELNDLGIARVDLAALTGSGTGTGPR